MKKRPLILVTNDDGISSPGLIAAAEAAKKYAQIVVAAPHVQQTGMGRAFPRGRDIGIIEQKKLCIDGQEQIAYGVHGSPALAAAHGILELAERKPDLCISGVNYGENLGTCLTCSGTFGAAFEAVTHGVKAIAVSVAADLKIQRQEEFLKMDFSAAKDVLMEWIEKALAGDIPEDVDILNINLPAGVKAPYECRITSQSRQNYYDFVKPGKREFGEPFALASRLCVDEDRLERDSDIYAVYVDKAVSVTPINIDMSRRSRMLKWVD